MNSLGVNQSDQPSRSSAARGPLHWGKSRLTRRLWLAVVAFTAVSCLSPTLPLPPPGRPVVEGPDSSGMVTLSGAVIPGAHVYSDNLMTGYSSGQQADGTTGRYRFRLAAQVGDELILFYIYQTEVSDWVRFVVRDPGRNSPFVDAGATPSDDAGDAGP